MLFISAIKTIIIVIVIIIIIIIIVIVIIIRLLKVSKSRVSNSPMSEQITVWDTSQVATVREKSGNFASSQGNSRFLVKLSEKSGNFILRLPQALIMIINFLWTKGNDLSKNIH